MQQPSEGPSDSIYIRLLRVHNGEESEIDIGFSGIRVSLDP